MTEIEAQNFISSQLQGLWQGWEPTDAQYGLWSRKLKRYDYHKAKEALNEWFCEQTINYKQPPINKILRWFSIKKVFKTTEKKDPIPDYELFDPEDIAYVLSFSPAGGKKPWPVQELEVESQRMRKLCSELYGRKLIVRQLWNMKEGSLL